MNKIHFKIDEQRRQYFNQKGAGRVKLMIHECAE